MKPIDSSYPAKEKLKSKKDIEFLFQKGSRITHFPFQMVYIEKELEGSCIKFGVSVRKKNFKKAVERNLLKRRMRYLYRTHKIELFEVLETQRYLVMLIYVDSKILSYTEMENQYLALLKKLHSRKQSG